MKSGILRLLAVAPIVTTPLVLVVVVRVVVIVVDGDVTHLGVLGGSIALIDGSGGRNGGRSRRAHLRVM